MTVKELIEAFQGLDENTPVVVTFRDGLVEHLNITGIYENEKVLEIEVGKEDAQWLVEKLKLIEEQAKKEKSLA